MRITEGQIRQIIREEISSINEMHESVGARQAFEKIIKICEEALLNKSFGFREHVNQSYIELIEWELERASSGASDKEETNWSDDE